MIIKANPKANYGTILQVMDAAKSSGLIDFGLANHIEGSAGGAEFVTDGNSEESTRAQRKKAPKTYITTGERVRNYLGLAFLLSILVNGLVFAPLYPNLASHHEDRKSRR